MKSIKARKPDFMWLAWTTALDLQFALGRKGDIKQRQEAHFRYRTTLHIIQSLYGLKTKTQFRKMVSQLQKKYVRGWSLGPKNKMVPPTKKVKKQLKEQRQTAKMEARL